MILNLLNNENDIRCKYELLFCLKYIFRYSNNNDLFKNIDSIITLLMNIFIEENISLNIKKLVLMNILEINRKRDDVNINLSLNKININELLNYFVFLFDKKIDFNLYPLLLQTIILIGQNNEELFNRILPVILTYIIKLFGLLEIIIQEKKQLIFIDEFAKTFKKIFPILMKNNKVIDFINELMKIMISLIKLEKNIYFSPIKPNIQKNILLSENENFVENQIEYNYEEGELSSILSILLSILNCLDNSIIQFNLLSSIEDEIILLNENSLDKKSRILIVNILSKIIFLSINKNQKSLTYLNILLNMIDKETETENVKVYFEKFKEIIEFNDSDLLDKNQIKYLFDKLNIYFKNLKIKINQLREKENHRKNNKKSKNDDFNDENYISNLIGKEIDEIEEIQNEIIEIYGILLKFGIDKCYYIIEQLIQSIIPTLLNSKNDFNIKLALSLCCDIILHLGQEQLNENIWNYLYNTINKYIDNDDNSLRQLSAYGLGIFAQKTINNFDKYSKGLINIIYQSLSYSLKLKEKISKNDEDFFLAFDNIIAAIGKIIFYHYDDIIVKNNLNDLITNWIINLPIKYDESEWLNQHEWMVNLFINKKELIPLNCYSHYFQCLVEIYQTKYSNEMIDKNIENIFINFVKKDAQLLNILSIIYENSSLDIKNKLNILAGQK
jgi:hypothetical protein